MPLNHLTRQGKIETSCRVPGEERRDGKRKGKTKKVRKGEKESEAEETGNKEKKK